MSERLLLSGIEIHFASQTFSGALLPYESDDAFRDLRSHPDLFAYRRRSSRDSQVLVVPRTNALVEGISFGPMPVMGNLRALARLIEDQLVNLLPKLALHRTRWGVERIRAGDDLLDAAFKQLRKQRPNQLAGMHKSHRTAFRVRHEYLPGRGEILIMTVEFRQHCEIKPSIAELVDRGLDLRGLEVFSRQDDTRKVWLGEVARVDGKVVTVNDGTREIALDGDAHHVEPSIETFTALFEQALGRDGYEDLRRAEWALRAKDICGRAYVGRLQQVADHFRKAGKLTIASSISVSFGDVVSLDTHSGAPSAIALPDVEYCFSWDRTNIHKYPSFGLNQFGPFDGTTFDTKEPTVLVVCPADARSDADHFVRKLRDGVGGDATQRFGRGLVGIYRLTRFNTRFATVNLPMQGPVGQRYIDILRDELGKEKAPDIVLVVVRDQDAFVDADNPYWRAKAFLLAQGIPSQEVRLSVVRSRPAQIPYVLENIAVAIYAKLGGSPWTIRPTLPLTKEVVFGMAHAQFGGRYSPLRRIMGITTVFSSDGTYLLAAGSQRCEYEQYPEILANSVREVLSRLATEQGWTAGDVVRLVFHAPKPLTGKEVETLSRIATRTLGEGIQFESAFLTIERDHPFKVVAPNEGGRSMFVERLDGSSGKATVGECAPRRGLVVDLGKAKRLLCVNGPLLMKREGESIPQPLQITLHRNSTYTDMTALTRQVFHFTGLSWRSMLPVTEPVTIFYPHLIADKLVRLSALPDWDDKLLDTRLRRSRWFL